MSAISWDSIKQSFQDVSSQLSNPDLENNTRLTLQKKLSFYTDILEKKKSLDTLEKEIEDAQKACSETTDEEFLQLCQEEAEELVEKKRVVEQELTDQLFPPSEHDNRSVFLEIRAGAGGKEAALFAADLLKMYTNYALSKGWRATVEDSSSTDLGGFREVVLHLKGKNAYGFLKYESGVHRVQRVPETEGSGRVHTSTATVAVLPQAKEVDLKIDPNDLRIDVFRASGAGGQHVNTTDSAVRITHIPTGVVVSCQDERSQHKNKAKAMKILGSRILAAELEKHASEQSKNRKAQVGTGMRAEKVRTYNYPQNRVTDHQVNLTLKNLDTVMEGKLDSIVEALREQDKQERQKHPFLS